MAEYVTRQFADRTTGTPITGGDFELRDPLAIEPAIPMLETTDPDFPGRYYSTTTVRPGVWQVWRQEASVWAATGEEISVSPGRTYVGDIDPESPTTILELVIGSTVQAAAFVPEGAALPTIAHLQAAIDYASGVGLKRVFVGHFKGIADWTGPSSVNAAGIAGIILDLGGARIKCNTEGQSVINMAGGIVMNGTVEGSGTDSVPEINSTARVVCIAISFPRNVIGTAATIQNGASVVQAQFIGCDNMRIYPTDELVSAKQQISDAWNTLDSNNVFQLPIEYINLHSDEVAGMFVEALKNSGAPGASGISETESVFNNSPTLGKALKNLWFIQKPKHDHYESCDQIVVKGAGNIQRYISALIMRDNIASDNDADLLESLDGEVDIVDANVDSGVIIRKYFRVGDTQYSRIEIEAFCYFDYNEVSVTPGASDWEQVAYAIQQININGLTSHMKDLDGVEMFSVGAGDATIQVRSAPAIPDAFNCVTHLAVVDFNEGTGVVTLSNDMATKWKDYIGSLNYGPSAAVYAAMAGPWIPFYTPIGANKWAAPESLAHIKVVLYSRDRTDLPRFK